MPEQANGGVTITLDGSHVRVDARPARLVALLKGAEGAIVTANSSSGAGRSEPLPGAARQATFRVRDDVTVEATSVATFVAVAEEGGRCLVIAYGGEVTVIPTGDDRFALGAHEALVIGGEGGPAVVQAADLSEGTHPELSAMIEAAADALLPAATEAPVPPPAEEPVAVTTPAPAQKAIATPATAAASPAKAASKSAGGQRRKKGKKGRPQPTKSASKKAAAGAGGTAAGAAAAAKATKAGKTTAGGGQPPRKDPPTGGGGGGGGGNGDEPDDDSPRERRFLIGAVLVGLVIAVVAVLVLSNTGDDDTNVATGAEGTSTTATEEASTTTSAPATTTTTGATTTTARTTTTTARTTTTAGAPAPKYSVEPKSCVQSGKSITYTGSVKNESTAPFDFEVDVSFTTSDGTEVAKATAKVSQLAAGRTADFSATGTSTRDLAGTGATCNVTRVDAQPSS